METKEVKNPIVDNDLSQEKNCRHVLNGEKAVNDLKLGAVMAKNIDKNNVVFDVYDNNHTSNDNLETDHVGAPQSRLIQLTFTNLDGVINNDTSSSFFWRPSWK